MINDSPILVDIRCGSTIKVSCQITRLELHCSAYPPLKDCPLHGEHDCLVKDICYLDSRAVII